MTEMEVARAARLQLDADRRAPAEERVAQLEAEDRSVIRAEDFEDISLVAYVLPGRFDKNGGLLLTFLVPPEHAAKVLPVMQLPGIPMMLSMEVWKPWLETEREVMSDVS